MILKEISLNMSKIVLRMEKQKRTGIAPLSRHVDRVTEHHSNPDIDNTKSVENIDMLTDFDLRFKSKAIDEVSKIDKSHGYGKRVDAWLNLLKKQQRRDGYKVQTIRKDAVQLVDFVVTSDHDFFANLTPKETENYFRQATKFFNERYGRLVFAQVHLDETTPHMHLGLVPIKKIPGKGYRLSAKQLFNRQELVNLQTDFANYMQKNGFNIERGQSKSALRHLDTPQFKKAMRNADEQVKQLTNNNSKVQFEGQQGRFMPEDNYQKLVDQATNAAMVEQENRALYQKLERNDETEQQLKSDNDVLEAENKGLKAQNDMLTNRVIQLQQSLQTVTHLAKKTKEYFLHFFKQPEKVERGLEQYLPNDITDQETKRFKKALGLPGSRTTRSRGWQR